MGNRCWGFEYPQRQWRQHRRCPGYENPEAYALHRAWKAQPDIKTPRELRQDAYPQRTPRRVYHLEDWHPDGGSQA